MTGLAELERAVRDELRFDACDDAYLHRAAMEDDGGIIRTRPAIVAARIREAAEDGRGQTAIVHDFGDMLVSEFGGWRTHRWVRREGARIIHETVVRDGMARARQLGRDAEAEASRMAAACPVHAPLGELRAGEGQVAAGAPPLPQGFPEAARPAALALHRWWNRRSLGCGPARWRGPDGASEKAAWILSILTALPDAAVTVERGVTKEDAAAVLWRLHGHEAGSGARIRLIGSTVWTGRIGDGWTQEETMLDMLWLRAQARRPVVNYGASA